MTEEAEPGVKLSFKCESEQQAPHFLQDVIFHGKFRVSVNTKHEQNTQTMIVVV